jgi:hypothetical protein
MLVQNRTGRSVVAFGRIVLSVVTMNELKPSEGKLLFIIVAKKRMTLRRLPRIFQSPR